MVFCRVKKAEKKQKKQLLKEAQKEKTGEEEEGELPPELVLEVPFASESRMLRFSCLMSQIRLDAFNFLVLD